MGALQVIVRSSLATLAAFISFGLFARYVMVDQYWVAGGSSKLLQYLLVEGPSAAVLAIPAAAAALALAPRIASALESWDGTRRLAFRAAAACSTVAGVFAAIALR
jgi:hypothetical protein